MVEGMRNDTGMGEAPGCNSGILRKRRDSINGVDVDTRGFFGSTDA